MKDESHEDQKKYAFKIQWLLQVPPTCSRRLTSYFADYKSAVRFFTSTF